MIADREATSHSKMTTGIPGLDNILGGGLVKGALHLISGEPGTGKTTLALQFLLEGAAGGGKSLLVTFSESKRELELIARAHGISLDKVSIREISRDLLDIHHTGESIFDPADLELPQTIQYITDAVRGVSADRLVIDSLTELRNVSGAPRELRRALLRLKVFLEEQGVTTLFTDTGVGGDITETESLAHGVVRLQRRTPAYGPMRRNIEIVKLRGVNFHAGLHDMVIKPGGLEVFPRIRPKDKVRKVGDGRITSGVGDFDRMLDGGLDRGTTSFILGPSGVGKSTLLIQCAIAAAERGERAALFSFDEDIESMRLRTGRLGLPLGRHLDSGLIAVNVIDAAEISPGAFAELVRAEAEERGTTLIGIDSINGYLLAMPEERSLIPHLHDLFMLLGRQGVTTLCVFALIEGVDHNHPGFDLSYLADTTIRLRYYCEEGITRTAVAIAKNRTGSHDRAIREFMLGPRGVEVGGVVSRANRAGAGGDL